MNSNVIVAPHTRYQIAKDNHSSFALPRKVAILYTDANPNYFSTKDEFTTVDGSYEEALTFGPFLHKMGIKTCYILANQNIEQELKKAKPDLAINLVTTVKGYDYLGATVPAMLELLEIPYTGASILGFAMGSNKYLTYSLLEANGLPVPRYQLMTSAHSPLDPKLSFPLILKLNEEHSNVEIKRESVVENEKGLRKRLRYLLKTYEQDVLVSEFIDGREFASFIFQAINKKVYTIERQIHMRNNKTTHEFMDYDLCWGEDAFDDKHLRYEKHHDPLLDAIVKKAFNVTKMDDYGKFDIRMDKQGRYFIIDANANCHFGPSSDDCEMTLVMKKYGIPFPILLKRLLQNTMREWGY